MFVVRDANAADSGAVRASKEAGGGKIKVMQRITLEQHGGVRASPEPQARVSCLYRKGKGRKLHSAPLALLLLGELGSFHPAPAG